MTCSIALSGCFDSNDDEASNDPTAVSITLSGSSSLELLAGESFTDPGATAVDSSNNTLIVQTENNIDTTTAGTYTLTYSASDSSGNSTSIERTITVLPSVILNIQSNDYFTGDAIEGSSISVSTTEDGTSVTRTGVTDADGEVSIPVADDAERIIISGDSDGYGEYSEITTTVDQVVDLFLQPANGEIEFTPSEESTLTVSEIDVVSLPANALVDENGNTPTETLTAEITIIDPGVDPSLMPGNYETIDSTTGEVEQIESFGAINVTFDDAEGNRYNLADGETATIRIPLASDTTSAPETIPLYHFDEETGYWNEEGSATLIDNSYYEGTVSHFSTWNADYLYKSIQITGCVENSDGTPAYLTEITTEGVDYLGQAWSTSDAEGNFSVSAKPNSTIYLSATNQGGLSRTTTITTGDEDVIQSECITLEANAAVVTLTWGENPSDLDTQFFGPNSEEGDTNFLMYYSNPTVTIDNSSIWLDVDDVTSYGPEITTISSFPYAGRYSYAVNHYSGSSDIAASPARVELDYNGEKQVFSAPEGTATTCWAVFDFVVDDSGAVTVETVGTWEDSAYCHANNNWDEVIDIEYGDEVDADSSDLEARSRSLPVIKNNPVILREMIESKYYVK